MNRYASGAEAKQAFERESKKHPADDAAVLHWEHGGLINKHSVPDLRSYRVDQLVQLKWSDVVEGVGFNSVADVALALRTSIGALKKEWARNDLAERLMTYCGDAGLFPPAEGDIQQSMFPAATDLMLAAGFENWLAQPEFDSDPVEAVDLTNAPASILPPHASLYIADPEVLITVDWDSHFSVVGGPSELILPWIDRNSLDGFIADQTTGHDWWHSQIQHIQ